ncbi:hypothetical protein G9A89_001575 [Geosiphon pyriformis]|nr:hypothetical protein G9A89_001575 [Geosiphon pyriformis]
MQGVKLLQENCTSGEDPKTCVDISMDDRKCPTCKESIKSIKIMSGSFKGIEHLVNSIGKSTEQYNPIAKCKNFLTTQFHINEKNPTEEKQNKWLSASALSDTSLEDLKALVEIATGIDNSNSKEFIPAKFQENMNPNFMLNNLGQTRCPIYQQEIFDPTPMPENTLEQNVFVKHNNHPPGIQSFFQIPFSVNQMNAI